MTSVSKASTTNRVLQPLAAGALTAGTAAGTFYGLHAALDRDMWKHPDGGIAHKMWRFKDGGVGRATLGASIMLGTAGLAAAELKSNGLTPSSKLGTAAEIAGVGAAIGGSLTLLNPIFHGRQGPLWHAIAANSVFGAAFAGIGYAADRQ